MNAESLKAEWKQVRGKAKEWWGRLTDDDLARIDGKVDRLAGILEEKYALAKDRAEEEVDRWLASLESGKGGNGKERDAKSDATRASAQGDRSSRQAPRQD